MVVELVVAPAFGYLGVATVSKTLPSCLSIGPAQLAR